WYALHDFRTIDWKRWQEAHGDVKEKALAEFRELLSSWQKVTDAGRGDHAVYSVVGQKADLLLMILRPTMKEINQVELMFNKDRKSTRLNSSHVSISYAVFCL